MSTTTRETTTTTINHPPVVNNNNTNTGGGLFGSGTGGGLFGSSTAPNTTTTNTGTGSGLFGSSTGTGLFGSNTAASTTSTTAPSTTSNTVGTTNTSNYSNPVLDAKESGHRMGEGAETHLNNLKRATVGGSEVGDKVSETLHQAGNRLNEVRERMADGWNKTVGGGTTANTYNVQAGDARPVTGTTNPSATTTTTTHSA